MRAPSPNRHSSIHNLPNARYIFSRFCGSAGTHGENDVFEDLCDESVLRFDGYFRAIETARSE